MKETRKYTKCTPQEEESKENTLYKCVEIDEEKVEEYKKGHNRISVTVSYVYVTDTFPTTGLYDTLRRQVREEAPVTTLIDTISAAVADNRETVRRWVRNPR